MSFFWRLDAELVDPIDLADLGVEQAFAHQGDAEAWLASTYADLEAVGVTAVSLFEEDRLVYGPMSLAVG